jgi:hypothetical protein
MNGRKGESDGKGSMLGVNVFFLFGNAKNEKGGMVTDGLFMIICSEYLR